MATISLVTGGSGFIALHLVLQLLERGQSVHATVRSLSKNAKVQPLKELQERFPGKLELFEADLLRPGSFAKAMDGCSVVYHVASPFMMPEKIKDGHSECVVPAVDGTRNVLDSVNQTDIVKRVVLTSSVGAICGDYIDVMDMRDNILHESYFNESSTTQHNPYHYSKVLAEKVALEMVRAQSRWDLVVICPGLVLGPSLSPASDSGSLFLIDELLRGMLFYGVPDLSFTTVDVRDVAAAHVKAAEKPAAHGRYIVAVEEMTTFSNLSRQFRAFHSWPWFLPTHQLPTMLVRAIGPLFGLSQEWMRRNLCVRFKVDNKRGIEELGVTYRPLEETLRDHYTSWASRR